MRIDKAIEILHLITVTPPSGVTPDFTDAIKLGIEAMKAVREMRGFAEGWKPTKLPGETTD